MTTTNYKKKFLFFTLLTIFFLFSNYTFAYEIKEASVDIEENFVLQPGKIEVEINPGGEAEKTLTVTNRTSKTKLFNIKISDFSGSDNPSNAVVIHKDGEKGPYSLKDYIKPELTEFTLKPKEQIIFSVLISIPKDATPGGLFGTILVSSGNTLSRDQELQSGGTNIISELAALLFVRVSGKAIENGELRDFKIAGGRKYWFDKSPESFDILYKNDGNVYLNPYGYIQIKNIFGGDIAKLEVEPYFSLPDSLRLRKIQWSGSNLFGKYSATLHLNRGYEDIVDKKTVTFWVIPTMPIVYVFSGLFIIILVIKLILSKFKITIKAN